MYRINPSRNIYNEKPWNVAYSDRIGKIKQVHKIGLKTVAYVYPVFDSSTFRYRGYNVVETLDYSLYWHGTFFQYEDIPELVQDIEFFDLFVLIRCHCNIYMNQLLSALKKAGKIVCFDMDDLIYHPKHVPSVIEALDVKEDFEWNIWYGLSQRYYEVAKNCNAFITTNQFLADYIKRDFDKPCFIIPNYLNYAQEHVSEEYFLAKQRIKSEFPFEIGYFSGSPTHLKDLMMLMPEMEGFLNDHSDARLKIVGYLRLPNEYEELIKKGQIIYVPFQDFIGLQYEQAIVDVNIVPLVNNVFSNCKSELKYFESAIVGTLTCATPSFTYAKAINNGENGFLCNVGEWYEKLNKVYCEKNNGEVQERIRRMSLEQYSGKNQVTLVEDVLNAVMK